MFCSVRRYRSLDVVGGSFHRVRLLLCRTGRCLRAHTSRRRLGRGAHIGRRALPLAGPPSLAPAADQDDLPDTTGRLRYLSVDRRRRRQLLLDESPGVGRRLGAFGMRRRAAADDGQGFSECRRVGWTADPGSSGYQGTPECVQRRGLCSVERQFTVVDGMRGGTQAAIL